VAHQNPLFARTKCFEISDGIKRNYGLVTACSESTKNSSVHYFS
jgi:hypothetical protein